MIVSIDQTDPAIGDHLLIKVELNIKDIAQSNFVLKRDWKNFCNVKLNQKLQDSFESTNISWQNLNVQEHWNCLENILLKIIDELSPLKYVDQNSNTKVKTIHPLIKNKINLRNRLLKLERKRCTIEFAPLIKYTIAKQT